MFLKSNRIRRRVAEEIRQLIDQLETAGALPSKLVEPDVMRGDGAKLLAILAGNYVSEAYLAMFLPIHENF